MHFRFSGFSGDTKTLGFFSDLLHVMKVKNQYLSLPGFMKNPNGFFVERIETNIPSVINTVFESSVFLRNEDFSFEQVIFNAVHFERKDAHYALETFIKDNEIFLKNSSLIVESTVDTYIINDNHWDSGFDSE